MVTIDLVVNSVVLFRTVMGPGSTAMQILISQESGDENENETRIDERLRETDLARRQYNNEPFNRMLSVNDH